MFYKQLENGKYRFYKKFYDDREQKWKQVTATMNSKSRVSQVEAKRRLAIKIDELLTKPTREELYNQKILDITFSDLLLEWEKVRKQEIKPSSLKSEISSLRNVSATVGNLKLSEYRTLMIQSYLMELKVANVTRKNRKIYLFGILDMQKS